MNDSAISVKNQLMTEVRPLVTFALFAFNQEKFIRAAVEAAFAQTYSPLEIILSDDCSGDNTFRIMQDLVRQYGGPHQVKLVQTPSNMGTFSHVMNSVRLSEGKLLVLAAGDDISLPNRVDVLVSEWKRSGAWGLFSKFDRIDEAGFIFEKEQASLMPSGLLRSYFPGKLEMHLIHGATSAYDRRLFEYVADFEDLRVLHEDAALSFILNLNQFKIEFVEQSLVAYRSHADSISNKQRLKLRLGRNQILAEEFRAKKYAPSLIELNKLLLRLIGSCKSKNDASAAVDICAIQRDLAFFCVKDSWIDSSPLDRFKFMLSPECGGRRVWMIPRLFGVHFFAICKSTFEWVRK